ncbi:hypothetical protein [uncultured Maribacter sp.]|uniref:hypothetical protein n=1 Tax=uncultured Maribacter sp. TaxID=431308 RepID=UPI002601C26B|nr:hypothetical protein [uncultured Maribacter sp.]
MKKIFLVIIILISITSCTSQNNPKINYKDYSYEFKADNYPKSITDFYKEQEKLTELTDRELAIKMNVDLILEDLIDNILRYNFIQNVPNLNETGFNKVKSKLTAYYKAEKNDFYTEKIIIDRSQQWIADSIIQSKYKGKIYYDSLIKTPKPKEAYAKMVLDLIDKNEIEITDDFLKKEIIYRANNYTIDQEEMKCDFNLIESWFKTE